MMNSYEQMTHMNEHYGSTVPPVGSGGSQLRIGEDDGVDYDDDDDDDRGPPPGSGHQM